MKLCSRNKKLSSDAQNPGLVDRRRLVSRCWCGRGLVAASAEHPGKATRETKAEIAPPTAKSLPETQSAATVHLVDVSP